MGVGKYWPALTSTKCGLNIGGTKRLVASSLRHLFILLCRALATYATQGQHCRLKMPGAGHGDLRLYLRDKPPEVDCGPGCVAILMRAPAPES